MWHALVNQPDTFAIAVSGRAMSAAGGGGRVALRLHNQTFEAERLLIGVTRDVDMSGERRVGSL